MQVNLSSLSIVTVYLIRHYKEQKKKKEEVRTYHKQQKKIRLMPKIHIPFSVEIDGRK